MRDAIRILIIVARSEKDTRLNFNSDAFDVERVFDDDAVTNLLDETPPELLVVSGLSSNRRDELLAWLQMGDTSSLLPVLTVDGDESSISPCCDAYDELAESATQGEIEAKAFGLVSRRGRLHSLIRRFDSSASLLAKDAGCEWVRSRTGIIGLVAIPHKQPAATLKAMAETRILAAHGLLESQPESQFSMEDVWNLILLISVAWSKEEAGDENCDQVLRDLEKDLTASRKIVLWRGTSPIEHIGPLSRTHGGIVAASADPALDAIEAAARHRQRESCVARVA